MQFTDLILEVDRSLTAAGLEHAFGGALALMHYVQDPRTTWDIDVNVSVDSSQAERVVRALEHVASFSEQDLERLRRDDQVRLFAGRYPIDIFLVAHEFHDDVRLNVQRFPFGETELPYISATHLAIFKVLFDRPKDWVDIQEMIWTGSVDIQKATGWLYTLLGDDSRLARFRAATLTGRSGEVTFREAVGRRT